MTQRLGSRVDRIRRNLDEGAQREFDIGIKATEEYKELLEKLAKV